MYFDVNKSIVSYHLTRGWIFYLQDKFSEYFTWLYFFYVLLLSLLKSLQFSRLFDYSNLLIFKPSVEGIAYVKIERGFYCNALINWNGVDVFAHK